MISLFVFGRFVGFTSVPLTKLPLTPRGRFKGIVSIVCPNFDLCPNFGNDKFGDCPSSFGITFSDHCLLNSQRLTMDAPSWAGSRCDPLPSRCHSLTSWIQGEIPFSRLFRQRSASS